MSDDEEDRLSEEEEGEEEEAAFVKQASLTVEQMKLRFPEEWKMYLLENKEEPVDDGAGVGLGGGGGGGGSSSGGGGGNPPRQSAQQWVESLIERLKNSTDGESGEATDILVAQEADAMAKEEEVANAISKGGKATTDRAKKAAREAAVPIKWNNSGSGEADVWGGPAEFWNEEQKDYAIFLLEERRDSTKSISKEPAAALQRHRNSVMYTIWKEHYAPRDLPTYKTKHSAQAQTLTQAPRKRALRLVAIQKAIANSKKGTGMQSELRALLLNHKESVESVESGFWDFMCDETLSIIKSIKSGGVDGNFTAAEAFKRDEEDENARYEEFNNISYEEYAGQVAANEDSAQADDEAKPKGKGKAKAESKAESKAKSDAAAVNPIGKPSWWKATDDDEGTQQKRLDILMAVRKKTGNFSLLEMDVVMDSKEECVVDLNVPTEGQVGYVSCMLRLEQFSFELTRDQSKLHWACADAVNSDKLLHKPTNKSLVQSIYDEYMVHVEAATKGAVAVKKKELTNQYRISFLTELLHCFPVMQEAGKLNDVLDFIPWFLKKGLGHKDSNDTLCRVACVPNYEAMKPRDSSEYFLPLGRTIKDKARNLRNAVVFTRDALDHQLVLGEASLLFKEYKDGYDKWTVNSQTLQGSV